MIEEILEPTIDDDAEALGRREREDQLAFLRNVHDRVSRDAETLAGALDEARALLDRSIEELRERWRGANAELLVAEASAQEMADRAERELRDAVIDFFKTFGEKQVSTTLKLGVRINRKFVTTDQKARLAWARENAPLCLRVDEAAFRKTIALLDEPPEFVKVVETPIAVIGECRDGIWF